MNDKTKIVLILAVALVGCVALYMYFSPYQTCVRGLKQEQGWKGIAPEAACLAYLKGMR